MEHCAFCEEEMTKAGYVTILKRDPDDWKKNVQAYGHKRCMMILSWNYERHGRIVTQKEVENMQFDPSI